MSVDLTLVWAGLLAFAVFAYIASLAHSAIVTRLGRRA